MLKQINTNYNSMKTCSICLDNIEDGILPLSHSGEDLVVPITLQKFKQDLDDEEARKREERRILYVAMTRAKKQLFLTFHMENEEGNPIDYSPFLEDTGIQMYD